MANIPQKARDALRPFWNQLEPVLDNFFDTLSNMSVQELAETRAAAYAALEATSYHKSGKAYWTARIITEQIGKQAAACQVVKMAGDMEREQDTDALMSRRKNDPRDS